MNEKAHRYGAVGGLFHYCLHLNKNNVSVEDRICYATDYAKATGAWTVMQNGIPELQAAFGKDSTMWWTRTVGESTNASCKVDYDGSFGYNMSNTSVLSIRPAICVDEQYDVVTPTSTPTPEPTTPAPVVEPTTPSNPDPVLGSDPATSVENKDYVYLLSGVAHVQDYGDTTVVKKLEEYVSSLSIEAGSPIAELED